MQLDELRENYIQTNPLIRSKETTRLLRISTDHFAEFLKQTALAADLTDENLVAYSHYRRQLGRKETTIERELAKLLTLARHAAILGLIPPTRIRQAKAQLKIPVAMLQHEMRSLFSAIAKYKGTIRGVPGHVFMLALLLTMLVTGERVNALCHVTRDDVDLRGRWIRVRVRKQNGNEMMKRLNRPTAKAIRALMESHNHERIFGIVHRTSLYKPLNDILRSAGLPVDRQHKFHCLRRSHASYLKRAGGDARASLGQSSEEITVKYYYDPRLTEHVHPVDLLFNPVSPWNRLLGWLGL